MLWRGIRVTRGGYLLPLRFIGAGGNWGPLNPLRGRFSRRGLVLRLRSLPESEMDAVSQMELEKESPCAGLRPSCSRWSPKSSAAAAGDQQHVRSAAAYVQKSSLIPHKDGILGLPRLYRLIKMRHFSSGPTQHVLRDDRHIPLPTPTIGIVEDLASLQRLFTMKDKMEINIKGKESFLAEIETDKLWMRSEHLSYLNSLFSALEPELKVRCLVSPYSLMTSKEIRRLCDAYADALGKGRPLYIVTAYDFLNNYAGMPRGFRREYLDFLCHENALITPDWFSLGTSLTHNLSDTGLRLPRHKRGSDDTSKLEPRFKGESDASYKKITDNEGNEVIKANIAILIWKDDEIIWSEMLEDICDGGSVEAAALAMALLLKRAIQMKISLFEVCTDCDVIDRVVRGEQIITQSDKLAELYHLLRSMRGFFEELVCRRVPREGMFRVDSLAKMTGLSGEARRGNSIAVSVPKEWRPLLSGAPIFSIKERESRLRNSARKRIKSREDCLQMHKVFYHLVADKEDDKLSAFSHICLALKPLQVKIIGRSSVNIERKLSLLYGKEKIFLHKEHGGSYNVWMEHFDEEVVRKFGCLNVLMDSELYKEGSSDENSLTIVFTSPEEYHPLEKSHPLKKLEEFGPLSFASFRSPGHNKPFSACDKSS